MGRFTSALALLLALAACESADERVLRLDREVSFAYLSTLAAQQRLEDLIAEHPDGSHPNFLPYRDSVLVAQAREGRLRAELRRAMEGR